MVSPAHRPTLLLLAALALGFSAWALVGASATGAVSKGSTIYFNSGDYDPLEGDGSLFAPATVEPSGKGLRGGRERADAAVEQITACTSDRRTRLAFTDVSLKKPRKYNVWVMDAKWKHRKRLTLGTADAQEPAFSPSCRRIVFSRDGDIWAVSVGRGKEKPLLNRNQVQLGKKAYFGQPSYSPDGKQLIISAACPGYINCNDSYLSGLYTLPLNGGDPVQLTAERSFDAKYSPDGKQIVFERQTARYSRTQIVIANADGSEARQITAGEFTARDPVFSPDGTKIAFAQFTRFARVGEGGSREETRPTIVISDLNGQNIRQIATAGLHPSWVAD